MPGSLIITIDGPAGTGKSTVAHRLAKRLGLEFLDTGAMYRAATVVAIESKIPATDGPALALAIRAADMHFDWTRDPPRLLLGDRDVTWRLRDSDVGEQVSVVAGQPEVRSVLVDAQRRIAARHPRLVTEGRDQGSVVFPDSPARFYLDARAEVRARRRCEQLALAGKSFDPPQILDEIHRRDMLDSTRTDGPLIRPEGAVFIDTSDLTLDDVVTRLEVAVRRMVAERVLASASESRS